ncbi:uncharacterized protein [Phyllobates terribilis]|uniref:uncharacterized protein n=1 Tax=Phyllobates terribilis TaxID=111132 RepID=UPI003CCAD58F
MNCEDKYQLLYLRPEDHQAATIPLKLVVSPSGPLKADLKRSRCRSVILRNKKDTEYTKLQPVPSSTLKSFPKQVHGNIAVDSTKSMKDIKETKPDKKRQTKMVTWVDELKKIDYPVSSQPFPSDFTVSQIKSPVTSPKQDRIPWTNVSPTPMASLSIPAKASLCPWGNEPKNLPGTVGDSVQEPQGSTFSQLTINTGFAFNAQMPNKLMRNYPTCSSSTLSYIPSNELNQPTVPTGPLSTVPYRPYHRTNPFLSPDTLAPIHQDRQSSHWSWRGSVLKSDVPDSLRGAHIFMNLDR